MSEQASGGPTNGGAANGGTLPLPATRGNFMDNMRAKTAAQQQGGQPAGGQSESPQGQRLPLNRNAVSPNLGSGAQTPPTRSIADRARAAEQQAKSTDAATREPTEQAEQTQEPVSRETAPEVQPDGAEGQDSSEPAAETEAMTPEQLLSKAKEWQDSPTLPEDFLDKLMEVKVIGPDGKKTTELWSVRDAKEGVMRQYDFSRQGDLLRRKDAELGQREQRVQQHFESINEPEKFLERHEDMGYSDVMDQALLIYAERKAQMRSLIRAAGIDAMERHGCDANDNRVVKAMEAAKRELEQAQQAKRELRREKREREQLSQRRQSEDVQAQQAASTAVLKKSLDQLRPLAFKAYGVADNGANETDFYRHLKWVTDNDAEWDGERISAQHCMRAAQSLSEELGDRRKAPKQQQSGKGAPLPPTRLAGPGGARAEARAQGRESKRPSDFAAQHLKRGF